VSRGRAIVLSGDRLQKLCGPKNSIREQASNKREAARCDQWSVIAAGFFEVMEKLQQLAKCSQSS
jgi:hypothetical protein